MIRTGTRVQWSYGGNTAAGNVTEVFHDKVTRSCQGNDVTRNATEADPAYLIEQDDGDRVLKSVSEVERVDG